MLPEIFSSPDQMAVQFSYYTILLRSIPAKNKTVEFLLVSYVYIISENINSEQSIS